jgi:hypothetical protein
MRRGNLIRPTIERIAGYWAKVQPIDEVKLNFDWDVAAEHCWNCGKPTKKLQMCHIIPKAFGGADILENYVLLCRQCHSEAPNTFNSNDMWDWIMSNFIPMAFDRGYKFRKALVFFKQKEGYSFFDKVVSIKNIQEIIKVEINKINTHEFEYNESTYYYMLKSIVNSQSTQI